MTATMAVVENVGVDVVGVGDGFCDLSQPRIYFVFGFSTKTTWKHK